MISIALNINHKAYPCGAEVIKGLVGHVQPGKITAIIGPSGCGKSTLLNMIAGLEHAIEGDIRFENQDSETPRIGYIFQTPRLMPWLTTEENLALICGKNNPNIKDTLEAMGMLDKRHSYPAELSGGMQRRVSIARAFVYNPDLLLLDEPFTSLDAPTANQLRQQLLALWQRQQSTMVFVTHDIREAVMLADEIWFMSRSPTSIIHTVNIVQPPERLLNSGDGVIKAENLITTLLSRHPDLLSGTIK
ncbi:ABC transporter ATP-binding protein [Enterovibrio sp. ZSDZ35]|uniref:ABC transporter ATP-binding protein n=1 Tax=Enterovibrio qingdaonensis TaxID=2899818 RepID=A0ABT5QJE2_9GAMM|nr:ABC transporter ATP-binding protein [Enterovibrio sp. ZSDZ35]MDD1781112.1 ABC transporter ATP-binding protein [Enterovibrio sp. ZSDZ35]